MKIENELTDSKEIVKSEVKCPKCESKARIYLYSTSTCMGYTPYYYDEDGVMHINENPNKTTDHWQCSKCGEIYSV